MVLLISVMTEVYLDLVMEEGEVIIEETQEYLNGIIQITSKKEEIL